MPRLLIPFHDWQPSGIRRARRGRDRRRRGEGSRRRESGPHVARLHSLVPPFLPKGGRRIYLLISEIPGAATPRPETPEGVGPIMVPSIP